MTEQQLVREAGEQISIVQSLSARCEGEHPPPESEVQEALERGFGCLVSLEARLQRAVPTAPAERTDEEQAEAEPYVERIDALRAALADLRRSSGTGQDSILARGFVRPPRRKRAEPGPPRGR